MVTLFHNDATAHQLATFVPITSVTSDKFTYLYLPTGVIAVTAANEWRDPGQPPANLLLDASKQTCHADFP